MSDHFTLDVDPSRLRAVAAQLDELSAHVRTKAGRVSATPDEIGDRWQGRAAASVKQNMSALGAQMDRYDERFHQAATALRGLAGEYEHALEVKVPELNRRYAAAQTDYDTAVGRADGEHRAATGDLSGPGTRAVRAELDQVRSLAVSGASEDRRQAWHALEVDFGHYKELLRQKTRAASDALASAVVVEVSDAQVEEFRRRSAEAGRPSPMSIGALERFDDTVFTLAGDAQYAADGREAAEQLGEILREGGRSEDEIAAYVALLETSSPAFRKAFAEALDPTELVELQFSAHFTTGDDTTGQGQIVTAVAQILAQGSNADVQGDYPVDPGVYDKLLDAYAGWGTSEGEGLMLLAEVVHAGQGGTAAWDPAVLTRVGDAVLAFEREQVGAYGDWGWSQVNHGWRPVTEAGLRDYGDSSLMDPLAMVLDSMHHDPVAAQDFLTQDAAADTDTLHYLYDRTAGQYFDAFGYSLGGLLDSATTFVGAGGPGSRDHVSAEIANDLVTWVADHPDRWRVTMDQDVVDILTQFMPAVNHPGSTMAPVIEGDPDAPYSWQRLTLPNLAADDLSKVMQLAFGLDYYSDEGRPQFQQFSAVQAAALRSDFMEVAALHGLDEGHLETLAAEQGELKQRTIDWLTESMKAQGAEADEANAAAREAADFVGGLLTDQIPVSKLGGPAGSVAGAGVEGIKSWALDQWLPLTDHQGEMQAEGHAEAIKNRIHGPDTYLNWLDEAGLLGGDADVERYAAQNPDRASFTVVGDDGRRHMMDVSRMRSEALAAAAEQDWDSPATQRWEDFMRYYQTEGEPLLSDHDINSNFQLGTLVEDSQ